MGNEKQRQRVYRQNVAILLRILRPVLFTAYTETNGLHCDDAPKTDNLKFLLSLRVPGTHGRVFLDDENKT